MPTPSEVVKSYKDLCVNCLACIRICPVKSVMFNAGYAQIFEEKCIYCGQCILACPEDALYLPSELYKAREIVNTKRTVAILAPEYVVSFYPLSHTKVEAGLEKLGFFSVEDTILAEELLAYEYEKLVKEVDMRRPFVRSTCPVVVKLVQKHYPEVIPFLAPLVSAPIAMGRLIKEMYGSDVATIYIGPCLAEKLEAEDVRDALDAVLTFPELKRWFEEERIDLTTLPSPSFDKIRPTLLRMYSVRGGFPRSILKETSLLNMNVRVVRGIGEAQDIFKAMIRGESRPSLVDFLACECCVDGPFVDSPLSLYARKKVLQEYYKSKEEFSLKKVSFLQLLPRLPYIKINRRFESQEVIFPQPTEEELRKILAEGGKLTEEDLYDCQACGYPTCREKAIAIYQGVANWEMCFPFQKKLYRRVIDELKKLSVIDGLTGLLNHQSFQKQLEIEFKRARRYSHPFSLLISDVDNFKEINDTYGHLMGDKVLKEVAKIIRESIRSTDIAGRYGGDEFVILLPETPLSDALVVAEKIRRKFSRYPIQVNDKSFNVTLSIGITAFHKKVENPLTLLDEADKALYLAKERGRDRTCVAKKFLENPQSLLQEEWQEIEEMIKRLGLEEK